MRCCEKCRVLGVWVMFWGVCLRRSLDIIRSMKPNIFREERWQWTEWLAEIDTGSVGRGAQDALLSSFSSISDFLPPCFLFTSQKYSAFGYWRSQDGPLWTLTNWNGAIQAVSSLLLYFYLCLPKHIKLSFYIKNCDTKITHVKNNTDRDTGLRRSRWVFNKLVDSPHFLIQLLIHLLISWIKNANPWFRFWR